MPPGEFRRGTKSVYLGYIICIYKERNYTLNFTKEYVIVQQILFEKNLLER